MKSDWTSIKLPMIRLRVEEVVLWSLIPRMKVKLDSRDRHSHRQSSTVYPLEGTVKTVVAEQLYPSSSSSITWPLICLSWLLSMNGFPLTSNPCLTLPLMLFQKQIGLWTSQSTLLLFRSQLFYLLFSCIGIGKFFSSFFPHSFIQVD